jgi:hypothetical protein
MSAVPDAVIEIAIEGVGLWATGLHGWEASHAALAGRVQDSSTDSARPAPSLLAPTERRRAPESVLIAVEVAQQACGMAGRDPRELPSVFASGYGDLEINDYLCAMLARAPLELSPTRFHNSVHNAPAGYWTIATGCMAASTAIGAGEFSFGAGLLEAAVLALAESTPVLFAAYDVAARGALADVVPCRSSFALALVVAPASPRAGAALRLSAGCAAGAELAPQSGVLQALHRFNPAARSLPLLCALAARETCNLAVPAGPNLRLQLEIRSWST